MSHFQHNNKLNLIGHVTSKIIALSKTKYNQTIYKNTHPKKKKKILILIFDKQPSMYMVCLD